MGLQLKELQAVDTSKSLRKHKTGRKTKIQTVEESRKQQGPAPHPEHRQSP